MAQPALKMDTGHGADVQLEHGYMRLANELLTALALAPWDSAGQRQLIDALLRVTYGTNRRDAELGDADWQALTGLSAQQVKRARQALHRNGVLLVVREFDAATCRPRCWRIQKDYTRWGRYALSPDLVVEAEDVAMRVLSGIPPLGSRTTPGVAGDPGSRATPPLGSQTTPPLGSRATPGSGCRSLRDNELQVPKDSKDSKDISSHHTTARERAREEGLEKLREYLGPLAAAADRMAVSAAHSPTWAGAILGLYGPSGTDERVWDRAPPESRPELLATALDRYAGEAQPYQGKFFRRFLESVIHERTTSSQRNHSRGPQGQVRGEARSAAAPGRRASGRRTAFKYE